MSKRIILIILLILSQVSLKAQVKSLKIQEAYELLESNYPQLKDSLLTIQIYEQEDRSLNKTRLPSIYLKADGRLQSESTQLEVDETFPLPFEINQPLYSIKAYLEVQYTLYDGGLRKAKRFINQSKMQAELEETAVEKFKLKKMVNDHFLNITMLRQQEKVLGISLSDLTEREKILEAGLENGVVLESDLKRLQVKKLELEAQKDNIQYQLNGLTSSLSFLIGKELDPSVELIFPNIPKEIEIPALRRKELSLFRKQQMALMANSELLKVNKRPFLTAYGQAGSGYPNPVNILDNDFAPYGLVGFSFGWRITDWRKSKLDTETLSLRANKLRNAEASFRFSLDSKVAHYRSAVERLKNQLDHDTQILQLQADILNQMSAQLDEGVITSADYIQQVNAELKARQNQIIHQTELIKTQLEFLTERGELL